MDYPLVATRDGVFAYMQILMKSEMKYRRIPSYVKNNFFLLRSNGEEMARFHFIKDNVTDITRKQIYDAIATTGELTSQDCKEIMSLEEKSIKLLSADNLALEHGEENFLNDISWLKGLENDFFAQLLAGASRRAVLSNNLEGAAKIGAVYGGPILMPYVEWLLHRSEELGIRRLYFIARDGYLLKLMADVLINILKLDINTHYIYGSRKAWRMPSYMGEEGNLREIIGWSHFWHIHTAEELADVLEVPVEVLRPYMVPEFSGNGRRLNVAELTACVIELDKSEEFRKILQTKLAEKHTLVVDYLRQEIDVSDDRFAFVELGGGGFTQICLSNLMREFYGGCVRSFFYKMDRVREPNSKYIFYNFFPSKLKNDLVVEMVCRAPEGQTEGYERKDGRVVAIKKAGERERYLEHGYGDYVDGVRLFTENYIDAFRKFKPQPSLSGSLACMNALAENMDDEITEFFGGLPNRVTGREEKAPDFAPPLTKRQVQDIFVRYADGVVGAHYQGTDFDMSLKRSTHFVRAKAEKYQQRGWEIRHRWLRLFPHVLDSNFFEAEQGEIIPYSWQRMFSQIFISNLLVNNCFDRDRLNNFFKNIPYSLIGKRVVLYGAGKRGIRWYQELSEDKAIEVVQWLDKDYLNLKDNLPVTGNIESLGQVPFDWILLDFANPELMKLVMDDLHSRGIPEGRIYSPKRLFEWISQWLSKWINYLHV